MTGKRILELLAIAMIGEGFAGLLRPTRYLMLWRFGPKWYQDWLDGITAEPSTVRLLCLIELGIGFWITLQETSAYSNSSRDITPTPTR
jgi:hypothetical protein